MDALVKDALDRVNKTLDNINWEYPKDTDIAKAVYAVDALKSSLKAVTPKDAPALAEQLLDNPEERKKYLEVSGPQTSQGALANDDESQHLRDQIENIKSA
jgi:hypothetical protein